MLEIEECPGWFSTDGRDRPTPEFVAYAKRMGADIVVFHGTLKISPELAKKLDGIGGIHVS